MSKTIVIATIKSWNLRLAHKFKEYAADKGYVVEIIDSPTALTRDFLEKVSPEYIFFPHWSWIIPREIYENFKCIVFHMTDLPFGRGGSPLQNLLSRGIYNTQISAIRVVESVDAGPIYFKEPLSLEEGNANEIFERAAGIVFSKMIPRFLEQDLEPLPQEGEVVLFKRRKPEESEINFSSFSSFQKLYDFIRMLDGEGYPAAFLRLDNVKITFTKVQRADGKLLAHAEIVKEN